MFVVLKKDTLKKCSLTIKIPIFLANKGNFFHPRGKIFLTNNGKITRLYANAPCLVASSQSFFKVCNPLVVSLKKFKSIFRVFLVKKN